MSQISPSLSLPSAVDAVAEIPEVEPKGGNRRGRFSDAVSILSKHPDETARFYSTLLGWKVSADNPLGYRKGSTGSAAGIKWGIWPAPQFFVIGIDCIASAGRSERRAAFDFRVMRRSRVPPM